MKKQNFTFFQYVWIFVAGCYGGFLVETVWCLIKNGYIESRKSLVLGHLSVAYGMGAVLLTLILVHFQQSKLWKIFLVAFFVRYGYRIHMLSRAGNMLRLGRLGLQQTSSEYKRQGLSFVFSFLGSSRRFLGKGYDSFAAKGFQFCKTAARKAACQRVYCFFRVRLCAFRFCCASYERKSSGSISFKQNRAIS